MTQHANDMPTTCQQQQPTKWKEKENEPALELPRQQIAQPALDEGHHPTQEKQPHPPTGGPEATAGSLAHRPRVKPVVDQVLQVLFNSAGEVAAGVAARGEERYTKHFPL